MFYLIVLKYSVIFVIWKKRVVFLRTPLFSTCFCNAKNDHDNNTVYTFQQLLFQTTSRPSVPFVCNVNLIIFRVLTANGRLKVKREQCWCKLVSDGQQTKTNELNHVIVFSWLIIARYSCPSLVLPTVANKERILKNITFGTCCNALWWLYRQCHAAKLKNIESWRDYKAKPTEMSNNKEVKTPSRTGWTPLWRSIHGLQC